jgi:Spy/CpxP family protein refolding chaperone
MSDLFDGRRVPLHDQVAAAEREAVYRRRVYPRLVAAGKLKQAAADHQIAAMDAIAETLRSLMKESI